MAKRKAKDKRKDERNGDEANPEYDNFQKTLGQVLSVPKEEIDKRRAEYERERKQKQAG